MDNCMQLAVEGERLMDNKRWTEAARYFESAIVQGTDNVKMLNTIYLKMWLIYHNIGNYEKALNYARYQLELARHLNDFDKEAFSSTRIGVTLSMLNRFEDACSLFLELLRKAEQKQHEAFIETALYHLGQSEFKWAKHLEGQTSPEEIDLHLHQAVAYFLRYKAIVGVAKEAPLIGRICGSLSHVYFKLGQLDDALSCQLDCLQTSLEFGDQEIQLNSKSFLGVIYCSMQKYEEAAEAFQESFYLAEQLNDSAKKAKALYQLANVMNLLEDYEAATELGLKYLDLVKSIGDDVGECHMYCFLCQLYRVIGELDTSLKYAQLYQRLTQKLRDVVGYRLASELCEEVSLAIDGSQSELHHQTNNGYCLDDSVDNYNSENSRPSFHCSTMLNCKPEVNHLSFPISSSKLFSTVSLTEHCEVNITDLDVSIQSEAQLPDTSNSEERVNMTDSAEVPQHNGCQSNPPITKSKNSYSDSHINSEVIQNGHVSGTKTSKSSSKTAVRNEVMRDTKNIEDIKRTKNGFHKGAGLSLEIDSGTKNHNFKLDDHSALGAGTVQTPCKDYRALPTYFRSPQIKRASRAGSEFEFDPLILAARKKHNNSGSTHSSKSGTSSKQSVQFKVEECESLYDLITKAQSVGRIDEQRVCLDRLNSKVNVPVQLGGPVSRECDLGSKMGLVNASVHHQQLRATKSYELSSKSSGPITSRQNSGGSGGETSSSVTASTSSPMMSPEQLIDHIAKHQSYRMNDQRSEVNLLPGLFPSPRNQEVIDRARSQQQSNFLDLLERCQDSRFDDQRTVLPPLPESATLPENEFLDTIQRIQISGRMDEQRTSLPPQRCANSGSTSSQHVTATANGHIVLLNQPLFNRTNSSSDQASTNNTHTRPSSLLTTNSYPSLNGAASNTGTATLSGNGADSSIRPSATSASRSVMSFNRQNSSSQAASGSSSSASQSNATGTSTSTSIFKRFRPGSRKGSSASKGSN